MMVGRYSSRGRHGASVTPVHVLLMRLRWRTRVRRFFTGASLSAVAALAILGVLRSGLLERWWPRLVGDVALVVMSPGALVGGLALVAGLVSAWIGVPSMPALASRADAVLRLQERLITAWELASRGPSTPILQLQRLDAVRCANQASAELVVSWRPSQRFVVAMGALMALSALSWSTNWWLPRPDPLRLPELVSEADGEELANSARLLASLLQEETTAKDSDQYLNAVADALRGFAERIDSGRLAPADADQELAELLTHLAEAVRSADPELERVLSDYLPSGPAKRGATSPADREELADRQTGAEVASPTDPEGAGIPENSLPPNSPAAGESIVERNSQETLQELLSSLQHRKEAADADASGEGVPSDIVNSYEFLTPEQLAAIELARHNADVPKDSDAQGITIGAAEDAGQGGGNQAGDGARPLDEGIDPDVGAGPFPSQGDEVALPTLERQDGQRQRVEVTPSVERGEDRPLGAAPVETWDAVARAEMAMVTSLQPEYRESVSRYFRPILVGDDAMSISSVEIGVRSE